MPRSPGAPTSTSPPLCAWCAAGAWNDGAAFELPQGGIVLIGLTVEIQAGDSVGDDLLHKVGLSALAFERAGGAVRARLATIRPSSDEEAKTIAAAISGVAAVLEGRAQEVALDRDLYDYIRSLPGQAEHAATPGARGWTFGGASLTEVRLVGAFFVAVEQPTHGPKGLWLSIFTDRFTGE